MTLKNYLVAMSVTSGLIWAIFLFLLFSVNPESTNWVGFALFYVALFLALSGTTAVLGFLIRFKILAHEMVFNSVKIAFRQSFLIAFLIVAILYLLSQNLFSWFNLITLVASLGILEFFLINRAKYN